MSRNLQQTRRDLSHLWALFRLLQENRIPWSSIGLLVLMVLRGLLEAVSLSALASLVMAATRGGTIALPSWLPARHFLYALLAQREPLLSLIGIVLALLLFKNGICVAIAWLRTRLAHDWFDALSALLCRYHQAASLRQDVVHDPVVAAIRTTDSAVRVVNTYLLAVMDGVSELWVVAALLGVFGWAAGPQMVLALTVPVGGIWFANRVYNRNANYYGCLRQQETAALQRWIQDGDACRREIDLYGCQTAFADRHAALASRLGEAVGRQRYAQDLMAPTVEIAGALGLLLLILNGVDHMGHDPVRLITGLAVCIRLLPSFKRLAGVVHTMDFYRADLASVTEVLSYPLPSPAIIVEEHGPYIAVLDNIDFTHPTQRENDTATAGLYRLTLKLAPGVWTALVGPTGIGKSTVVDVLLGRLQPQGGQVRWAGGNRCGVGYLGPMVTLLSAPLRDNLAFPEGRRLNDATLWQALRIAQAADIVARFPDGLDHPMGAMATSLSVGECQRLGLARAILHTERLLILDEATSGLDLATEEAFFQALRQAFPELSVLLITHRPATACHASVLFGLYDGALRRIDKKTLTQDGGYYGP